MPARGRRGEVINPKLKLLAGLCLKLGLFGIVRVYNPNSWITIPMTRIVGKIYENTKEIKENNLRGAAGGSAFVFFIFLSIFVYFANNPSHWDGNPGIGIVNPNNPSSGRSLYL